MKTGVDLGIKSEITGSKSFIFWFENGHGLQEEGRTSPSENMRSTLPPPPSGTDRYRLCM